MSSKTFNINAMHQKRFVVPEGTVLYVINHSLKNTRFTRSPTLVRIS